MFDLLDKEAMAIETVQKLLEDLQKHLKAEETKGKAHKYSSDEIGDIIDELEDLLNVEEWAN